MQTKSVSFVVIYAGIFGILGGCATTPPGYVAREWSKTMRELGITPVFPPREDVQVGDIYMAPTTPEAEKALLDAKGYWPLGVWISTADTKAALNTFYGARSSFPITAKNSTDQPRTIAATTVFDDTDAKRLRLVGFPVFMSTTLSQGSLSGLIPTEGVSVAAAAGFTENRRVTVTVPRAESYALPAALLLNRLTAVAPSPDKPKQWNALSAGGFDAADVLLYLPIEQRNPLEADTKWKESPFGYVRVITEVFYARELDVTIESSKGAGLAADIKPIVAVPGTPSAPSRPTANELRPNEPNGAAGADSAGATDATDTPSDRGSTTADAVKFAQPTPQTIAAELNRQLDQAKASVTPGGGARFVTAGTQGIGMRVTFERPMAIGYRGVLLKVYANRDVVGAGSLGSAVPTAKKPPSESIGVH